MRPHNTGSDATVIVLIVSITSHKEAKIDKLFVHFHKKLVPAYSPIPRINLVKLKGYTNAVGTFRKRPCLGRIHGIKTAQKMCCGAGPIVD